MQTWRVWQMLVRLTGAGRITENVGARPAQWYDHASANILSLWCIRTVNLKRCIERWRRASLSAGALRETFSNLPRFDALPTSSSAEIWRRAVRSEPRLYGEPITWFLQLPLLAWHKPRLFVHSCLVRFQHTIQTRVYTWFIRSSFERI